VTEDDGAFPSKFERALPRCMKGLSVLRSLEPKREEAQSRGTEHLDSDPEKIPR
jgi:hypothetical protein